MLKLTLKYIQFVENLKMDAVSEIDCRETLNRYMKRRALKTFARVTTLKRFPPPHKDKSV